ncbi:MAG: alpha-1,4-glucan--maltose-1-phosphate maltosyltransferase [Candidatus Rokubacteria bacterium]|nr:alpha-1,4-glucan--maltose-1-phosphate maltosyltransferase [Candidatus Rokubacteria bacterium]MBI3105890.1 alpha-1,4-glucan--maltose-1-phosphate maltosyltransferase [Candidatus Rokubacteria bacterium]
MIPPPPRREREGSIVIEHVQPAVDDGRYPCKREVGDHLEVSADIFKEGHDVLEAVVLYRSSEEPGWSEVPMRPLDNDRWSGHFPLERNTRYLFTVEAWTDVFGSWVEEMGRRLAGGQTDLGSELLEGRELMRQAAARAPAADAAPLRLALERYDTLAAQAERLDLLLDPGLRRAVSRAQARKDRTRHDRALEVVVDRVRARWGAWYELFPRSQGTIPGRHGTFDDCVQRLPDIQRMGFDVVYLTPIHPIGRTHRKGRNNSLVADPADPGSPWAIGGPEGGHTAVHKELGTLDDFRRFLKAARGLGIEIAMDFAIQCSPDHPWVQEHPEWFYQRPDGTIKHAENPPKKYQDIYPVNFSCEAWESLWEELRRVVLCWVEQGVRIFRVDNPHTKPLDFWRWLIREVQDRHPDVVFLAEAFTRPKVMKALGKAGFTQSYTFFTWRNFKEELAEYFEELTRSEMAEYFRGNLFCNTPDILPEILQRGGPPAFKMRAALAATLSPLWGIYSGYELCEAAAVPGTEEYLDSEKYEIRVRDWDRPGHIKDYIAQLNRIRRENPALHGDRNLRFYEADSPHILFYGKMTETRDNVVLVAVNLDPFAAHEATLHLPLDDLGFAPEETYELHDLLSDSRQLCRGPRQTVTLDPRVSPARVYRLERWRRRERDFQYFY